MLFLEPRPTKVAPQLNEATDTPTAEAIPVAADNIDRNCPEPPPEKPDYNHYYLSGQKWPDPLPELGLHFWLGKPLAGGGRLIITDWLPYGYDAGGRYLLHNGVDSAEAMGTPVVAVSDGVIIVAGSDSNALFGWRCNWYGQLVVILLDETWQGQSIYALYGHVLNIVVQRGQQVRRGDLLAEVGFGGAATVPHLHFEIRIGENDFGSTRNPLLWLAQPQTRGSIAGRVIDPIGRPWQGVPVQVNALSDEFENHVTWTYLDDPRNLVNPDETVAENFVISDLVPGEYEVMVFVQGQSYREITMVSGGMLSTVELVTEAFKTPTPFPGEGN